MKLEDINQFDKVIFTEKIWAYHDWGYKEGNYYERGVKEKRPVGWLKTNLKKSGKIILLSEDIVGRCYFNKTANGNSFYENSFLKFYVEENFGKYAGILTMDELLCAVGYRVEEDNKAYGWVNGEYTDTNYWTLLSENADSRNNVWVVCADGTVNDFDSNLGFKSGVRPYLALDNINVSKAGKRTYMVNRT